VGIVLLVTFAGLFTAFGPRPEPDRVTVQHILISFQATRTMAARTQAAAEALAGETLARARDGEDFDALMKARSDGSGEGIYTLRNTGVTSDPAAGEFDRSAMVAAFGDVGFRLRVSEIRMAPFDAKAIPYGWHIFNRIR
jgi:hypothetical protein